MKTKTVIRRIEKLGIALCESEREDIECIISYHECEPMAAAERIADLLNEDYKTIINLL